METIIDRPMLDEILARFQALSSIVPLNVIRTKTDYKRAVNILNQLLDAGAANQRSPLAGLATAIGTLISEYEDVHVPKAESTPEATLRFLMEQHELKQSDLSEVGTQGVVSEILAGKRQLNVRQIKLLAERFHVPASVFI